MNTTPSGPSDSTIDRRALWISLLLLFISCGIVSPAGSTLIALEFTDRPMPRDALFELLPYVGEVRYLSTLALTAGFVIFMAYTYDRVRSAFPTFITIFAMMYFLRAGIMILNPLANAHGPGPYVFPLIQNGMFPSGHVAVAVLFTRLTDAKRAPGLRRLQAVLAIVVGAALVLSHGHYSIDIVGGMLLSYFVEREWMVGHLFDPVKRLIAPRSA